MENTTKYEIISETEFIKFVNYKETDQSVILVKTDEDLEKFKIFKFINVHDSFIGSERFILLVLDIEKSDLTPWYDLIVANFSGNLYDAIVKIRKIFDKEQVSEDYLKFRGDYAEALFISKNKNAKKLYEKETADIELNGEIIEIKSFSPSKNSITISLKQIQENTSKKAIPLLNDNNGKTIIDLSKEIPHSKFREYLVDTYEASKFVDIKYKNEEFIDINDKLPKLELPKNILSADFVILIK